MVWDLSFDDFSNTFCSQGKYPLLTQINNILKNSRSSLNISTLIMKTSMPTLTTKSTTTTITSTTTTTKSMKTTVASTTTTTTTTKSTTTTVATLYTTTKCSNANVCQVNGDGMYPDYCSNCKNYLQCVYTGTVYAIMHTVSCPSGTLFNKNSKTCDWPSNVNCI